MSGTLYVVATPIGNLEDLTKRAERILNEVDAVACEDTRRTAQLLNHLGVRTPLIRYDEHIHKGASERLIAMLEGGRNVALVSDAGTPALSDPGARLVEAAAGKGLNVVPIPGPSSVPAALSASGFPGSEFVFLGFLPRRPGRAERVLRAALGLGRTVLLMESPHRVGDTLQRIAGIDPKSRVVLAKEITKIHETFLRGTADEVRARWQPLAPKGEIVLVIRPSIEPED